MSKKLITIQKKVDHPLEEVFDIEPGSTEIIRQEQKTELVKPDEYDAKDSEIEDSIQEIYDKAMSGYEFIQDECEDIEGRYLPRMMEVGVQHLKMALDAAQARARMKELKDKLAAKSKAGPSTVNNNLVIGREELLKMLTKGEKDPDAPD